MLPVMDTRTTETRGRDPYTPTAECWAFTGPTRSNPQHEPCRCPECALPAARGASGAAVAALIAPVTPAALAATEYSWTPEGHELATVPDAVVPALRVTVPEWRLALVLASVGGLS